MASGTKRTMICCICMQRIDATIVQAKAHGWTVWVGGAFCKRHVESDDDPLRAEIAKWKKAAESTQWELEQTKGETFTAIADARAAGYAEAKEEIERYRTALESITHFNHEEAECPSYFSKDREDACDCFVGIARRALAPATTKEP